VYAWATLSVLPASSRGYMDLSKYVKAESALPRAKYELPIFTRAVPIIGLKSMDVLIV
jgi:hypothetical protein